jgi:hypothetical protein
MKLYGGIDLHANNSVVVVIDEQDHTVYQKRLHNDLPEILPALAPYQQAFQGVVVESTYNWYWLGMGCWKPATGYTWRTRRPFNNTKD